MNRLLIVIGILALIVVGIVFAGDYNVNIGNVKKARIKQILITFDDDENVIKADCYWRLIGQQGQVLLERAPSSCPSTITNMAGWADFNDFTKNDLKDHRQAMKAQFKED